MSLRSLVSHLTDCQISSLMDPYKWRSDILRSLSISFSCEPNNSSPRVPPTDHDRLAILRALVRDPTPFAESRILPGFPEVPEDSTNAANRGLAHLSWPSRRLDTPDGYLRDIVWNIICIFDFARLGIGRRTYDSLPLTFNSASTVANFDALITLRITRCPLIGILDLPPPPEYDRLSPLRSNHKRRRSTEATIAGHLLVLAQNYYRSTATLCLPDLPSAQPCLLATRWLRTGTPVYITYTTQIPSSYFVAIEAHCETPKITVCYQEFDATDDAAMMELLEVLLRLVPTLVLRMIQAVGGEKGAKALVEREQERLEGQRRYEQQRKRKMERRSRSVKKRGTARWVGRRARLRRRCRRGSMT